MAEETMDVEKQIECLNKALRLQHRSVLQYSLVAGSVIGLEYQAHAEKMREHSLSELEDATRLVEKITALGGQPTTEVWYYEQPSPEGRKQYTKTLPIQYEELGDCLAWWSDRVENERAWKVSAGDLLANGCNLDVKNPRSAQEAEHRPPEEIVASLIEKERRILTLLDEIRVLVAARP